jgi:hypothetical protein
LPGTTSLRQIGGVEPRSVTFKVTGVTTFFGVFALAMVGNSFLLVKHPV